MPNAFSLSLYALALLAVLAGCSDDSRSRLAQSLPVTQPAATNSQVSYPTAIPVSPEPHPVPRAEPLLIRGVPPAYRPKGSAHSPITEEQGDYTLNFDNADIRDAVKAVLGDTLQLDYSIDPGVQGALTVHTGRPLPRAAVLSAFEAALRLSNIVLIPRGQGYEIAPAQDAARHSGLADGVGLTPGFHVVLYPLKYVSAAEIQRVLDPLVQPGTVVRIDGSRNLITLAGTENQLENLVGTIATFDVDWLRGQSFGLFPLRYAAAKSVATELGQVLGTDGPLAGLVKVQAIDRLNAILVVSPQTAYVEQLKTWIDRFDRGGERPGTQLYVYHVQHGSAAALAGVLSKAISPGGGRSNGGATADQVQPNADALGGQVSLTNAPGGTPGDAASLLGTSAGAASPLADVRITADDSNNALIIMATAESYQVIEAALKQLDTIPLQVLLEASVAEVTLTDDLQYGVQYFLRDGQLSALQSKTQATNLDLSPGGFSFLFSRSTNIKVVLDLLSSITQVKVVSSPQVMVLNNRTASLQVGDQVPVATSSSVAVQNPGAPQVNTIEMRDTGVILKVTPRVNEGGMVLLELSQEVSASVPTTTSGLDSPTIQQRKISSTVAVQDGQTLALGGLISDNRTTSRTGIPWLGDLPVVGTLFSDKTNNFTRTELLVLITPHVVYDEKSAHDVTEELRAKLPLIHAFDAPPKS